MSEHWKLKILSGIHKGAQLPLSNGEYVLGSDDLVADIVIADEDVVPLHCQIKVTADGIYLIRSADNIELIVDGIFTPVLAHEKTTSVSSDELSVLPDSALPKEPAASSGNAAASSEDSHEILSSSLEKLSMLMQEQVVIEMGVLCFAIARIEEPWHRKIDEAMQYTLASQPKKNIENIRGAGLNDKHHLAATNAASGKGLLVGLLVSLIPIIFLIGGLFYKQDQDALAQKRKIQVLQEVQSLIRVHQLDQLSANWVGDSEQLLFQGYIATHEQQRSFFDAVNTLGVTIQSRVRVVDEIVDGVRFILKNMNYTQLSVEPGTVSGSVNITGVIEERPKWERVERILARDVPGLVSWELIEAKDNHFDDFQDLLRRKGLLDKLSLTQTDEQIAVKGSLSDAEVAVFNQVKALYNKQYGSQTQIIFQQVSQVSQVATIEFPVRSVSLGSVPFVILSDSQKYIEGALVNNGYRILSIKRDRIELVKNQQIISIQIGENNDKRYQQASHVDDIPGRKTASR